MANRKNTRQENVRNDINRSFEEADTRDVFEKALDDESAERQRRMSFDNSSQQQALRKREREEIADTTVRILAGTAAGFIAPNLLRKISKRYRKFTESNPEKDTFGENFHESLKAVSALGGGIGGYASADRPVSRGRFKREQRRK